MKQEKALSMSTACVSPEIQIATAAAISEGLNSKKSIPAFIPIQQFIEPINPQEHQTTKYNSFTVRKKKNLLLCSIWVVLIYR